jgi:hypothetical protein
VGWDIAFYNPPNPAHAPLTFLDACPKVVRAKFVAVLDAVAAAPPPRFSGGGMWEAMHGDMGGYYEVRTSGPGREQFRLFCVLENPTTPDELQRRGLRKPAVAVITGMRKPWKTAFSDRDYARVRDLGTAYLSEYPRKILH